MHTLITEGKTCSFKIHLVKHILLVLSDNCELSFEEQKLMPKELTLTCMHIDDARFGC
mgnify:CR=1 FL=1